MQKGSLIATMASAAAALGMTNAGRIVGIHTPQRVDGETRADYIDRRKASKEAAKQIATGSHMLPRSTGLVERGRARFEAGWYGKNLTERFRELRMASVGQGVRTPITGAM